MSLIVAKFGGTSVATTDRIKNVAQRLVRMKNEGNQVVAVVSAMGKTTDDLVSMCEALNPNPPAREMDRLLSTGEQVSMTLLAMAIEALGVHAMSFTGRQAGIQTDGIHEKAKIVSVDNERIMKCIHDDGIAVVAGFQGIDHNGDITTLGRGGSDTTAVAVAYGLGADECQIFSDVVGVYTADPRVCPHAHKLDEISYDDMLELSAAGSGVLQMRAVEFARKYNVVIHSRSAFSEEPGTLVKETTMEKSVITGIAHDTSEVKVTVRGVPDITGVAGRLFQVLSASNVSVDMIIQGTAADGLADISFTCPAKDVATAKAALDELLPELGAQEVYVNENIAKVSLVGTGMKSSPGVAAKAFSTLAEHEISILAISTSPIRLSVVVGKDECAKAVQCLHTAFGMDVEEIFEENALSPEEVEAKKNKGR
ncbi:MAG: aspartate kinase [Coriobacteriia bacterium]|nr:aspartate kinase [Coriobacteriia bacterium]